MTGWRGQRGTRHERGYGAKWDKLRVTIMRRDDYLCQECKRQGQVTPARECDHIVPKSQGGTDSPENLQAICRPCHRIKTDKEAAQAQGRKIKPAIGTDGWPRGRVES